MKKVLSLVLVIAMVLSSLSFAFAAEFEDVVDNDYEKAINTLAGLGIIDGYEDGTFRPENIVTRAEMAKLMVEILGYGNLVAGAKSNFSDTQGHWADPWIAIAAGRNIVVGTGDGKFTPDRQVSYDEVLTMIVRGLGYTDDSNEIKSMPWPTNFKVKAAELGITDAVKLNAVGADRGGVAQALYNALDCVLVSVDNDGNVTSIKDVNDVDLLKTLISRVAIPAGKYEFDVRGYVFEVEPKHIDPDSKAYAGDVVDLEEYLFENVEAYYSKVDEKTIVYVARSYSDTVKGIFEKHDDPNKFQVKQEDGTKKAINLTTSADMDVYYNGDLVELNEGDLESRTANTDNIVGLDNKAAQVKVVMYDRDFDTEHNGDVKAIVVTNPTFAQKVVAGYREGALKLGRIDLPKKGDNVNLDKVTVTGAVDDIFDIKADDVVVVYAAGGAETGTVPSAIKLVVSRDTVEGMITRVNKHDDGSTSVYVDGTKYTRSEILGRVETFDVGYEGTFFMDDAGKLFAADATDIASAQDYAVVIESTPGYKAENSSTGRIIADAEIKLINAKGEVVTYKVDKDAIYVNEDGDEIGNVLDEKLDFKPVTGTEQGNGIVKSRTLMKYRLDGSVIDQILVIMIDAIDDANQKTVSTDSKKFEVAKDAPIFSVKPGADTDKGDYSVVDPENLPSSINVTYADYTGNGQYKVIVSTDADRSVKGTFALITGLEYIMDGNNKVAEITGYVDGKEVTYLGKDRVLSLDGADVDTGVIHELTLSGGKVTRADIIDDNVVTTTSAIYVGSVAGTRLTTKLVSDNTVSQTVEMNFDNLTIYVLNAKDEFDYVETNPKSIVGLEVVAMYNLDKIADSGTSNRDVEIIVVQ